MQKSLLTISFIHFLLFNCGPPKPNTMPEPIDIYQSYTKEELTKMLNSDSWIERSSAVLYIQKNFLKEFTKQIFIMLQKDPSSSVRQISALALADFGFYEAIPTLLFLLKNPKLESGEVIDVVFLIDAIGKFKDYNSIKKIIVFLKDDDSTKRLKIVKILEESEEFLTNYQKDELGKIILNDAMMNKDQEKSRTYAMALGRLKYKPAEEYLLNLLRNPDEFENTKAASILALGKIKSTKSIPILFEYLKNYPSKLSENSYIALKEIKDKRIVEPSFNLIQKERLEVQLLLVDILTEIPEESIKEKAYSLFRKKNKNSLASLSLLLGKLKYKKATKEIEEILKDKTLQNREIIAQSLGWMQDHSAIPTLIEVLQEKEGEGRYGAAWSLGVLEAQEATPYLIKMAKSKDQKLAILSIEALGHIKDPDSLDVLEDLIKDKNKRMYAIDTLTYFPNSKALYILKKYAFKEGEVSHLAIEALSKREEKEVVPILIKILKNTDTESIKAKLLYKALQRKTKKDYITKNQWIEWYNNTYDN